MDEIDKTIANAILRAIEEVAPTMRDGEGGDQLLHVAIAAGLGAAVRLLAARPASGSEDVPRGWHVRSWANQHGDLIVNFGDGLFTWRRAKWETLEAAARAADAARGERGG